MINDMPIYVGIAGNLTPIYVVFTPHVEVNLDTNVNTRVSSGPESGVTFHAAA